MNITLVIFQSTCPMRGMTDDANDIEALDSISIHMPHAGHDENVDYFPFITNISIHMPHAGHDGSSGNG